MRDGPGRTKNAIVVLLVIGITFANYLTYPGYGYVHFFLQRLFFVPLILSGFWFGLRGALVTSFTITIVNLPYIFGQLKVFSPFEFNQMLQMAVFNMVAVCLGVLRDRERKERERMRELEQLSAMGKAMSSVAHDMKTPLVAIGGFARLVQNGIPEDDPKHQKMAIVIDETRRLERLVQDMLDFARPLELEPSRQDFGALVEESLAVVEEIANERGIHLESRSDPELSGVFVDPFRMKQAIINLVMNGIQASSAGKTVTVYGYCNGKEVIVDIMDSGCGIPPEKRKEVFAPFFTTKREGTGLGLPIVKRIVDAHEGSLKILDGPEGGITVRVVLPRK